MTAKKSCKYSNYGSFEHLLFLVLDESVRLIFSETMKLQFISLEYDQMK